MLVWLDSNSNVKGKPNENYARELMELFSLGVGHYTEDDVREAARAFTGWRTDGKGFAFDARFHDDGPKTVLGQTGPWDGGDVVRIVLEQPSAGALPGPQALLLSSSARRPSRRTPCSSRSAIRTARATTTSRADPDHPGVQALLLESRVSARVKGPVEYVLGAVQAVYRRYREEEADYRSLPQRVLVPRLGCDGQSLFAPPKRQGLAGRTVLAEHRHPAGARQLRRALAMGDGLTTLSRSQRSPRPRLSPWDKSSAD